MIDLRSDTVTLPPPEMRAALAAAEVGDDVYGEDPSVNALQARVAELLGKEAALYVPSGTMGNLVAHLTHSSPGDEVICGLAAHTFNSEVGGPARIAGVSVRTIPQDGASLDPAAVEAAIRDDDIHQPRTALLWIEQPSRGHVMPLDRLEALARLAWSRGLKVHLDGSRVFNAALALGVPAAEIVRWADSAMFCLSKGLAAPVGSMLVGSREFIARAKRNRKVIGGELRQAGFMAAAGLYAVEHMLERLAEDHAHARRLAEAIRELPGLSLDREVVETNIFFVEIGQPHDPRAFAEGLRERGVLVTPPQAARRVIRFVTHYGIESADVDRAIDAIRAVAATRAAGRTLVGA